MIIACSGKGRSGKGEFAKIAVEEFGFTKVSFADSLKEEVASFLKDHNISFEWSNLYGENVDREKLFVVPETEMIPYRDLCSKFAEPDTYMVSFRSLLQWWGTEFRRTQDVDYWVKQALGFKCRLYDNVVIDDLRFENEANALVEHGATLVRVERPNNPTPIQNPWHASETGLDSWKLWHWIIENTGELDEYHDGCRLILREVLNEKGN